ncbi:MAG: peptidase S24 [Peptococcaceae bacterium]|jgi:hypothetical protein|nr:peptidase S24 [Peptococcaceae bacterium]
MSEVTVKAVELFSLVSELLEQGQSARISVTGTSMYPFLRHSLDSVEFSSGNFAQIARGDIVLSRRLSGAYVMHRVWRKEKEAYYIVGDAQQWIEGPLEPQQLVAVVEAIWRKDRRIACSKCWWRCCARIWLLLRPYRYFIMKCYRKMRKIIRVR